jgi:RNA polymerase sigma-70 factor (ECF subfamily)
MAVVPLETGMAEDDLIVRARRDRTAFAVLYDRYYLAVMRYCLRRLFMRPVAEDVASEAFLQVARGLPNFAGRTETDFRRWLYRIVTNGVNAHLRQTRRRQELLEAAARSGRLTAEDNKPAAERLDWPAVYQAVLELDERDQSIVMLRFFADLPHEEIGSIVGATSGAVRTALSRILDRLRTRIEGKQGASAIAEGQS